MLDREPFLQAIFANPADDLPRLVFADYLEEHGESEWAELIRLECELAPQLFDSLTILHTDPGRFERLGDKTTRAFELRDRIIQRVKIFIPGQQISITDTECRGRGFYFGRSIEIRVQHLLDPDQFRKIATTDFPDWYGATKLKITGGRITPEILSSTLVSPVTEHVIDLDLSGEVIETPAILNDIETNQGIPVFDMELRPVVNLAVIEALAQSREARRLVTLNLENNDLDNDAARAFVRSPNFLRLKRLSLFKGNRFRAGVWQQLHEKYGPNVVDPAPGDAES